MNAVRLPPVLEGDRRLYFLGLLGCGAATASLAGASAWSSHLILSGKSPWLLTVIISAALGVGGVRTFDRILAEKLGQSYIHQVRVQLIESALQGNATISPGILIARTTNDLSAVRNWIALGIAPLATSIPLVVGVCIIIGPIHPLLGLTLAGALVLLASLLIGLGPRMQRQSASMRRKRGRLASATADLVAALDSVRMAGAERRESRQVDRLGQRVAQAAIVRSHTVGVLRGAAVSTAALLTALIIGAGAWHVVSASQVTAALLAVGVISTPLSDLGRVVEYRKTYLAARAILLRALSTDTATSKTDPPAGRRDSRGIRSLEMFKRRSKNMTANTSTGNASAHTGNTEITPSDAGDIDGIDAQNNQLEGSAEERRGTLLLRSLVVEGGTSVTDLIASPGDRILIKDASPDQTDALISTLTGITPPQKGIVAVSGFEIWKEQSSFRRKHVGVARGKDPLPPGSVDRAIRYRRPGTTSASSEALENSLGFDEVFARLDRGRHTRLKRGGNPLTADQRALVVVARAAFREPDVLIIDGVFSRLTAENQARVSLLVQEWPGVVLTTDWPLVEAASSQRNLTGWRNWSPFVA